MEKVKKVTLSSMLFAIGLILPFFIGQIPAVGKMLPADAHPGALS